MKISRRELFNRVWSTPMSRLAKEFDISDVGLAKACRRSRIPTPPVGSWAKVAAGKAPQRPALPPFSVLEIADVHASRDEIVERESHWKRVLLSRSHGYNAN